MMVIGAAITLVLLVGVVLVMFAIKLPLQFAIWEAITAELKSSDPARRRTARISIILLAIMLAIAIASVVYYPVNPRRVVCVTGVAAGSVCNSRASCFCNSSTELWSNPVTRQSSWT